MNKKVKKVSTVGVNDYQVRRVLEDLANRIAVIEKILKDKK